MRPSLLLLLLLAACADQPARESRNAPLPAGPSISVGGGFSTLYGATNR